MKPAARVGDMHVCPMVTPGVPPIPHVGGPILPPGVPTVLIGMMPAAPLGNMCTCVGPPSTIIMGSTGVLIQNRPAARLLDPTAHGGMITGPGCPTVLIGEISPGMVTPGVVANMVGMLTPLMMQAADHVNNMLEAAFEGTPFCLECSKVADIVPEEPMDDMDEPAPIAPPVEEPDDEPDSIISSVEWHTND